ncbi:MAG: hypothetical protein Q9159_006539 [Coniocarpon cinnabarinum]
MFLFEYRERHVLYTGDFRAEGSLHLESLHLTAIVDPESSLEWFVNALVRHPSMLPFVLDMGGRRLDCIYLDTSCLATHAPFASLPSKADGLAELMRKLSLFPSGSRFYFHAWTFGYEDVMRLLANVLGSKLHLDRYRYCVYTSLAGCSPYHGALCHPASGGLVLSGFAVGNERQEGILTQDDSVRLHCCEPGSECWAADLQTDYEVVHIKPILTHCQGKKIPESVFGEELKDLENTTVTTNLTAMCQKTITDKQETNNNPGYLPTFERRNGHATCLKLNNILDSSSNGAGVNIAQCRAQPLQDRAQDLQCRKIEPACQRQSRLPPTITFPYARHSSYEELRLLVARFRPRDVYPCTTPRRDRLKHFRSMGVLFGSVCHREEDVGVQIFRWDRENADVNGGDIARDAHSQGSSCAEGAPVRPSELISSRRGAQSAGSGDCIALLPTLRSRCPVAAHLAYPRPQSSNVVKQGTSSHELGEMISHPECSLPTLLKTRRRAYEAVNAGCWAKVLLETTRAKRQKMDIQL